MKRYFPKTAAAWNTALVELRRWNKSRAVVCRDCTDFGPRRRLRTPLAINATANHRDRTDHRVKVSRFG